MYLNEIHVTRGFFEWVFGSRLFWVPKKHFLTVLYGVTMGSVISLRLFGVEERKRDAHFRHAPLDREGGGRGEKGGGECGCGWGWAVTRKKTDD